MQNSVRSDFVAEKNFRLFRRGKFFLCRSVFSSKDFHFHPNDLTLQAERQCLSSADQRYMANIVEHKGIVVSAANHVVEVRITVEGQCEGCKAQAVCGMGETNERTVRAWSEIAEAYSVGEEVVVGMKQTMGVQAVVWADIVPFFAMLATLLGLKELEQSDLVAGGWALATVAIYYGGLYLFRERLEKVIIFKVKKL
jgi:sigma-E factor negative regulatory protein RseC